jgi:AcrR family transcriptional regulator
MTGMARLAHKPIGSAQRQLMEVACRLFAERGVDGVTVREIAAAAGQKNSTAVGYHFGSKEGLIRHVVVEGARVIDDSRNRLVDRLEAAGGPGSVREITDILIQSSVDHAPDTLPPTYLRFVYMLGLTHRDWFMEALGGEWNSGYQRCLAHLRKFMPVMDPALKNQRFVFMANLLGSVLAIRQYDALHPERPHPEWQAPATLVNLSDSLVALLTSTPSEICLDQVDTDLDNKGLISSAMSGLVM